ncbi:MAG: segregation/condensation protein A [Alicyclobacillus herbarius]|uniref:segregation and condensation protein A n=1 Tax=Alicyclobacillus herbarius TaxID=122960 RepID=UPI0004297233|nr:segregation/condensation protein A [Alicyclobacillus herbarius]MCL6631265.1 segregation/condensation protein A [Alicyclobacillus herbarius]
MAYEIVLDAFSGPLDLLLHLIQKHEIDIHDIPIALVTEQYMEYLRAMEELSLEIASEFLVMAATLLAIKSRMLLPRHKPESESEEEVDEDPREQLVQQLLEYQRCKWAAERLQELERRQSLVFSREPMDLRPYAPDVPPPEPMSMWVLIDAYRALMRRVPAQAQSAEIKGSVISVDEMMETILERLRRWRSCRFHDLVPLNGTREDWVSAFLALLELMKERCIRCTQEQPFDEIQVELVDVPASA